MWCMQASAACVASKVTTLSQLASTSSSSAPSTPKGSTTRVTLPRSNCRNSSFYGDAISAESGFMPLRSSARKQGLSRVSRNGIVATATDTATEIPSLGDLPLINYINQQGRIQPPVEASTTASVFAICDQNKKIQVCIATVLMMVGMFFW